MQTSARTITLTYFALLILLAATVALSLNSSGSALSITGSVLIAAMKAALILWVFMELSKDPGPLRLVAAAAVLWVILMFLLASTDYLTRVNWAP